MLMLQANEVFKVGKPFLWCFNGCLRKQNIPEPRYIDFTNKGITSPGVCCNPAVISGPTSISFLSQLILFLRPCQKRLVSLSLCVTLRYTVVIQLSIYNIYTMYMPCICHVYAMYMPCICHVYHMTHMTTQCTLGKSILSPITGITSGSLQWSSRLCQQR